MSQGDGSASSSAERILELQAGAGNALVARALLARQPPSAPAKAPPVSGASSLAAQVSAAWKARHDKGEIFTLLRGRSPGSDKAVLDVLGATPGVSGIFAPGTDDCWLAATIYRNGPEPLWPPTLISERTRRAHANAWAPEPGNIAATLEDPNPDPGQSLPPVEAFFFPGRSDRRALVIGGVHGTEPQGVEVVERLRTLLAKQSAAGKPPFFTTILVPVAIPRTHASGDRNVPGGTSQVGGKVVHRPVEPNRNFPLPGEGYAQARARGAGSPDDPELVWQPPGGGAARPPQDAKKLPPVTSIRMLPETRILITLIERFQPERIASVHAHSLGSTLGDAPGIFVDPRKTGPTTSDPAQEAEDDRLAEAMLSEGEKRKHPAEAFTGNVKGKKRTVRYSSTKHVEGTSLGDWAPVPVTGSGPGARGAITTVTIEVPQFDAKDKATPKKLDEIEDLDRDLLREIFLEDPAVVAPAPAGKPPPAP